MEKRGIGKKGQFFIVFSVILGIIILSVATVWNTSVGADRTRVSGEKFNLMCSNYRNEIWEISEYAIEHDREDEPALIEDFTRKFIEYAERTDKNFGLFYVYGKSSEVRICNFLDEGLVVNDLPVSIGECKSDSGNLVSIENEKINKEYELDNYERFWFVALTEKEGEEYVCE